MDKIFLIDGHAQIFRMYYAFMRHPLINSKGVDTSILYGFTKMILELRQKESPTHLAVVFDSHAETFRHKIYKEYKANRPAAPEQVIAALEPLKSILKALNIPCIMQDGVEADDIIGSIAKQWSDKDCNIYMVTPDKDYGQLLTNNIYQYKLPKGGNGSVEIVGEKEICAHYGIKRAESVIDILTLWGDSSDNVPGVKGIGEVGAKKLIGEFDTVENLLLHTDSLPAKQKKNIEDSVEQIKLSKFLVTIKTDVELHIAKEQTALQEANMQEVDRLFSLYEFNSLKKLIKSNKEALSIESGDIEDFPLDETTESIDSNYEFSKFIECAPSKFCSDIKEKKKVAIALLANSKSLVLGCQLSDKIYEYCILSDSTDSKKELLEIFTDKEITKIGYNLKPAIKVILDTYDKEVEGEVYDIELLHYIINPERSHAFDFIAKERLKIDLSSIDTEVLSDKETQKKSTDIQPNTSNTEADLFTSLEDTAIDCPDEKEIEQKVAESSLFFEIAERLIENLGESVALYKEIEMPLLTVLARMELCGVKIDTALLNEYGAELNAQMAQIEKRAKELANDSSLNLSSSKQVGILLYEKLKVDPTVKKNAKGNYSTSEATLRAIEDNHPIIREILEYRNLKKLISTYIEVLPEIIDKKSGKVHTNFNQALTATGRLSSNNPNLQNIPIRTERGREIRKAFIPSDPKGFIVSADYSQIELRLMAHLSGDISMIEDFNSGKDIHIATASKLFNTDIDKVTEDQRRRAKSVNFGIIYGISSFGLSERMDIGVKEAKEFIETYFKTYGGVSRYINESIEFARNNGFVQTIYGRKRYLPEINSRNSNVRKFNERNAVNAPLQGSAADIIKLAMINVDRKIREEGLRSRMILQVHDELVFDVVEGELDKIISIAENQMNNVIKLKVPLIADCGYGKNWLQAH